MKLALYAVLVVAAIALTIASQNRAAIGALTGLQTARTEMAVGPTASDAAIVDGLSRYSSATQSDLAGAAAGTGATSATLVPTTCSGQQCITVTLGTQTQTRTVQTADAQDTASTMSQGQ